MLIITHAVDHSFERDALEMCNHQVNEKLIFQRRLQNRLGLPANVGYKRKKSKDPRRHLKKLFQKTSTKVAFSAHVKPRQAVLAGPSQEPGFGLLLDLCWYVSGVAGTLARASLEICQSPPGKKPCCKWNLPWNVGGAPLELARKWNMAGTLWLDPLPETPF